MGLRRRSSAASAIRCPTSAGTAAASAPWRLRVLFRRRRSEPLEPHRAPAPAAAPELLKRRRNSKMIQLNVNRKHSTLFPGTDGFFSYKVSALCECRKKQLLTINWRAYPPPRTPGRISLYIVNARCAIAQPAVGG